MTRRALRVWGWIGYRGRGQTREIVAAASMAEVARLAGKKSPRSMFCLEETGNGEELATALAQPGIIFWQPLDARGQWRAADPA